MAKPMYQLEQLERELEALKQTDLRASTYYLKQEIKRRKASAKNPGRPRKEETLRRKQLREAQARFRQGKRKELDSVIIPIDET